MTFPATRPRRRTRRQATANAVVAAYLAAAAVVAASPALVPTLVPAPRWLAVHLALLGAASNAILTWGEHFATALLRVPPPGDRTAIARLVGFNAAAVAVFAGVLTGSSVLTWVGAIGVAAVGVVQVVWLRRLGRRALAGQLAPTAAYFADAAAFLVLAVVLGALAATGWLPPRVDAGARLAHLQVAALGWVGLAVVGTLFTLWPTVLRTRMVDGVVPAARRARPLLAGGLLALTAVLLAGAVLPRPAAALGAAAYAVGLGIALSPFLRTIARRPPTSGAAWQLGLGVGWYAVVVAADVVALAAGPAGAGAVDRLGPVLAAGAFGQLLVGALSFLLPTVLGGGPAGNRRLTAVLETAWIGRAAATNAGTLLLLGGPPGIARAGAVALVVAGLGSFVPLVALALLRPAARPPDAGSEAAGS